MSSEVKQNKKELTISAAAAQGYALLITFPLLLVLVALYGLFWAQDFSKEALKAAIPSGLPLFAIIIGGIILHELIHGISWARYAENGWRSIKFGIIWKFLTPYCHCTDRLNIKAYRFGAMMPGIVLGIIPALYGIIFGNLSSFVFGFFFTLAAGGDLMILWMLRKETSSSKIEDHPTKIGCYIYS